MIDNFSYDSFFPYPHYRREQENIIRKIEGSARKRSNMLLVTPNGTGKTVIALSALLPVVKQHDLKLIYLCRTHSQSDRVIKELKKIHGNPNEVLGLSLRGRNEMCLNHNITRARISPSEALGLCKELRKGNKCKWFRHLKKVTDEVEENCPELFIEPINADELIEYAKQNDLCPYFLAKRLLRKMRVIVCNFQWILNPEIHYLFLKLIESSLEKCVLVIDECHNIIDVATEVNSKSLNPNFLTQTITYMNSHRFEEKYVRFVRLLRNFLTNKKREISSGQIVVEPQKMIQKLAKALKLKNKAQFKSFLHSLEELNIAVRKDSEEGELFFRDFVRILVRFWYKWLDKMDAHSYFFCVSVSKSGKRKYVAFEIVSLDAREITVPILKRCYASLCLSGTVNPKIFANLTGLHYKYEKKGTYKAIVADSPFPSRNILALITRGVSTANEKRVPNMFSKINEKISEILSATPGNAGIFCASYSIMNSLMMQKLGGIVKDAGKKLFMEDSNLSASENALLVQDFKSFRKYEDKSAVLLGVCGGRNSEGEDFPGDMMSCVIIVGIPYHYPDEISQAKITYYDEVFNKQGWMFGYLSPAMQRANQASGRPIRKLDERGVIVFMDERFIDRKGWISHWVQKELKAVPDKSNVLYKVISEFWNL